MKTLGAVGLHWVWGAGRGWKCWGRGGLGWGLGGAEPGQGGTEELPAPHSTASL